MPKFINIVVRTVRRPSTPISEGDFLTKAAVAKAEFALVLHQEGFELRGEKVLPSGAKAIFTKKAMHGNQAVIEVYLIVGPGTALLGGNALSKTSRYIKPQMKVASVKVTDNMTPKLSLRLEKTGQITSTLSISNVALPDSAIVSGSFFTKTQSAPQVKSRIEQSLQRSMVKALGFIFK